MPNNNTFNLRHDASGIPVAGLESAPDAVITAVEQLAKITATQTTSSTGGVTASNKPLAALLHSLDHQGNLQESYGVTVTDASTAAPYYAGNIDPVTGTFTVYSNVGLTTAVLNTSVNYTFYFLAPVVGTLNADGTITPNVQLTGSNVKLLDAVTATVTGAPKATGSFKSYDFEVGGTATSFTVHLEAVGSLGVARTIPKVWDTLNNVYLSGSDITVAGFYNVAVPAFANIQANPTVITGGNLTVTGGLMP